MNHYHGYSVSQLRDRSLWTKRCMHPSCGAVVATRKLRVLVFFTALAVMLIPTLLCTDAFAARPPLSQARADDAAHRVVETEVSLWVEDFASSEDPVEDPLLITGYDLDPCEDTARSAAECDVTLYFSDGDICDDTVYVSTSRRNKILASFRDDRECDSWSLPA